MSRRVRLSTQAREDLRAILLQSTTTFGAEQAKSYNARIKTTLASLRASRAMAIRDRDALIPGLRSCRIAGGGVRHLVFFRREGDLVEVVRVLHEAMDFPRHIGGTPED